MIGNLIYKCRLCGELHKPIGVPNVMEAMVSVVVGKPFPEEWGSGHNINILELHNCEDGRIGLSVLVGAEQSFL